MLIKFWLQDSKNATRNVFRISYYSQCLYFVHVFLIYPWHRQSDRVSRLTKENLPFKKKKHKKISHIKPSHVYDFLSDAEQIFDFLMASPKENNTFILNETDEFYNTMSKCTQYFHND